jgi:glycerol-3-phosphate acyltransferase PlsX
MKIAIDAMGGDYAPAEAVKGAVLAAREWGVDVVLVGDQTAIRAELENYRPSTHLSVAHASQVILMNESPVAAIKSKKDSSINVGLRLVKNGEADAFVSAGNTGAVMSAAVFVLGRIEGIERPAIACVWPTKKGKAVLLDFGANADCRPKQLYQFAHLGSIFAERVLHIKAPVVGLLNIGQEENKGTDTVQEAHALLKTSTLNFIGNVEGNDILKGDVHVFVCDGFVGNMLLKFAEGLLEFVYSMFKTEIKKSPVSILGALLMKPVFRAVRRHTDYDEYGGALMLGVQGVCIKAHGRSNHKAIKNAIRVAKDAVDAGIVEKFAEIR